LEKFRAKQIHGWRKGIVYRGAVANGTASYSLPRSAFVADGLPAQSYNITLRAAREGLPPGSTVLQYIPNTVPSLALVSPADAFLGTTSIAVANLTATVNISSARPDAAVTASFTIDDDPTSYSLGSVVAGPFVRLVFQGSSLDLSQGAHTIYLSVNDGTDPIGPVLLRYTVTRPPVLNLTHPEGGTWGSIGARDPLSLKLTIVTPEREPFQLLYKVDGPTEWQVLAEKVVPNAPQAVSLPSGFPVTGGLHFVRLRAVAGASSSPLLALSYVVGAMPVVPGRLEVSPGQSLHRRVRPLGPTAAERSVTLRVTGDSAFYRIDYRFPGQRAVTYGHFPPGPVRVVFPLALFASLLTPGESFAIEFSAYDGTKTLPGRVEVSYRVNTPPSVRLTPTGPLSFGEAGPSSDLTVRLALGSPDTSTYEVKYAFDGGAWNLLSTSLEQTLTIAEFAPFLQPGLTHAINFSVSDGVDTTSAAILYTVAPPTNHSAPAIELPPRRSDLRFRASGPTLSDRSFDLTVSDPNGGLVAIEYSIDDATFQLAGAFPGTGAATVIVPADYFTPFLSPGTHTLTFRAANEFNGSTAVVRYAVNRAPLLTVVEPTGRLSIVAGSQSQVMVTLAISLLDADQVSVQYRVDPDRVWHIAANNVTSSVYVFNLTSDWGDRAFTVGLHHLRLRLDDGLDASEVATVQYKIQEVKAVDANVEEADPDADAEVTWWSDLFVDAVPGIAVGIAVTIAGALFAVVIVHQKTMPRTRRTFDESSSSSSSFCDSGRMRIP
jgi:hypothetical protein